MNKKTIIDITKIVLVESAKGYVKAVAYNIAALLLLAVFGIVWMKVDEFRKSRKKR